MKMVIMIVAAIAILGGGGAGAYLFFMQPAEAAAPEVEEHKKEAKKKDEKGYGSEPVYVELKPLIFPLIDPNGASQVISVVVALEVSDDKAAEKVEKYKPRLKDAYLQDMYGALNRYAAMKGGQLRLNVIKKRLNMASKRVLGDDVINDVLLQVVNQRPI